MINNKTNYLSDSMIENPIVYKKIVTQKGQDALLINNYIFIQNKVFSDRIYFLCDNNHITKCKAKVTLKLDTEKISNHDLNHNHEINSKKIAHLQFMKEIKEAVKSDPTHKPLNLFANILSKTVENSKSPDMPLTKNESNLMLFNMPSKNSAQNAVHYLKKQLVPKLPLSKESINLPKYFQETFTGIKIFSYYLIFKLF